MKYGFKFFVLFFVIFISLSPMSLFAESKGTAFLKSFVVPGWGELSSKSETGYFFIVSELSLWFSIFFYNDKSNESYDNAYSYALEYASMEPGKMNNAKFINMSRYKYSGFEQGGYNEMVVAQANAMYRDNEVERQKFIRNNIYKNEDGWNWQSNKHRLQFQQYLFDETDYKEMGKTLVGMVVINHFLSGLNSLRVFMKDSNINAKIILKKKVPFLSIDYKF